MDSNLRIFLVIAIFIYFGIIINLLRKKNLNLKYTLIWLFSGVIMFIVVIFPDIIFNLSKIIGIIDPVNVVFMIGGMFGLIILLSLTAIVSHLNDKNRRLIQVAALMEKRIRELEEKINKSYE